jgi:16S rRNA pseudouridine516 synthase
LQKHGAARTVRAMREQEALDYFLTRRGVGNWASVRELIHHQAVSVNGVVTKKYHYRLRPSDVVRVGDVIITDAEDIGTLIFHKPAGYACSHDSEDAPLIYELIPAAYRHPNMQTVGRLDRDTTGLIILTIDGQWAQRIVSPRKRCWKTYEIQYSGALHPDSIAMVSAGISLPDEKTACLPARLSIYPTHEHGLGRATLHLCEGRYHQVKRMIQVLGGRVEYLHRSRIGGLDLPADLPCGVMRPLSESERAQLMDSSAR